MLKIKLQIGNKRKLENVIDAVIAQEDMIQIEAGRICTIGENPSMKYWKTAWIDKVSKYLWKRNLELLSPKVKRFYKIRNKILINYTIQYVKNTSNKQILYIK